RRIASECYALQTVRSVRVFTVCIHLDGSRTDICLSSSFRVSVADDIIAGTGGIVLSVLKLSQPIWQPMNASRRAPTDSQRFRGTTRQFFPVHDYIDSANRARRRPPWDGRACTMPV